MLVEGEPDVPQVIHTAAAASGLAGGLDGGQQERHQDANDGDHHQQFHERKP